MGIFGSVILKLFKMGFFCFVLSFSNSFYKGIGGYFEIILPLNPLKIPLTPQDRFFNKVIACLRKLFVI